MSFTLEEQETIIRWDRKYPDVTIYTFEPSLKRKLIEFAEEFPAMVKLEKDFRDGSVEYKVSKSLLSKSILKRPRAISEETKERLQKVLTIARENKRPEARQEQMNELQAF